MSSRPHAADVNPAAAVHRNARYQADHIVLRYAGGDLTFARLDDRAARLASVLADGGVAAGQRVAYLGLNSPTFIVTMLAAFRLGAIFVPVNFRLAGPELAGVLEQSGAATIVCEEGHRTAVESVRGTTALKRFFLVDDTEVPAGDGTEWEPWSALLAAASPSTRLTHQGFDDPAVLMFTSGTTGLPKGVILTLTHGNVWWNSVNVDTRLDVAVIGTADEQWGETVVAVVSLTPGTQVTLEDVREPAATRLARYKLPRRLEMVDSVPRNASGKLDKIAIRCLATGRS